MIKVRILDLFVPVANLVCGRDFLKKEKSVPILTKMSRYDIKNIANKKGSAYREKEKCYKSN